MHWVHLLAAQMLSIRRMAFYSTQSLYILLPCRNLFVANIAPKSMFPKKFFKNLMIGFCREFDSEQPSILNTMLKIRSYSSGNRRNVERAYGFSPTKRTFSKDFLTFLAHKSNFRFHMSKIVHFPEKQSKKSKK